MGEREPRKEIIGKGELFFLCHPGTEDVFSGYGLTVEPGRENLLVGLLMIDRPRPADPKWLQKVENTFGEYQLVLMTAAGERGIACRMQIQPESLPHLRRFPTEKAAVIKAALQPLLQEPPNPTFTLRWDEERRLWESQMACSTRLLRGLREVFEGFGYGCLAVKTDIGVVHVCHAADADIENFAGKPVRYQWHILKMPTAPLIRLEAVVLDRPGNPYLFESFLNPAEDDQADLLAQLAGQDRLYLAFYGDDYAHHFTKAVEHDWQQWQYLDELVVQALYYWETIPPEQRDFDHAKAEFIRRAM